MPSPLEWLRILGAWWRDSGEPVGDLVAGAVPVLEVGDSPSGLEVRFRIFDAANLGHWEPLYNGDSPEPEPIFFTNTEDVPDILMIWLEP